MSIDERKSSLKDTNRCLYSYNSNDFGRSTGFYASGSERRTSEIPALHPIDNANISKRNCNIDSQIKLMSYPPEQKKRSIPENIVYRDTEPVEQRVPSSPSIDVENDDSGDNIMSPVSIPTTQQKALHSDPRSILTSSPQELAQAHTMELTAASVPSGFPLNYQQLYASNAALYGTPAMFSGALHAAHASYMAGLPIHAALAPSETYLKAIQAAACGIYSPTALPPPVNPNLMSCKSTSIHNPAASMIALTPSAPVSISKAPQCMSSDALNKSEVEQQKDYISASSLSTASATKLSSNGSCSGSGTYLNDKVTDANNDAANDSHFKVPNGKEGSLKHRILRPTNNECVDTNKSPSMRAYSTTSNFKKGTYIELANGTLRRVEDMRTEDFIQCAERSPHHQLAESTVVKINTTLSSTAIITFSYDRNRSKVDMEVSLDHPFFVYGQGWASCCPEVSSKVFGLKCQRLQVGDICISLTKRGSAATNATDTASYQRRHSISSIPSPNTIIKSPVHPASTNSTPDIPYSQLGSHAFPMPAQSTHQHALSGYTEMAKLMSSYAYAKGLPQLPPEPLKDVVLDASMLQSIQPKMVNAFYQNQIYQFAQQHQQELYKRTEIKYNHQHSPPPLASTSTYNAGAFNCQSSNPSDSNQSPHASQILPLDVSMSRKRRWSAPENMFDDDEADTQPPRNSQISNPASRFSPVTART